jgi:hypothetical protein
VFYQFKWKASVAANVTYCILSEKQNRCNQLSMHGGNNVQKIRKIGITVHSKFPFCI